MNSILLAVWQAYPNSKQETGMKHCDEKKTQQSVDSKWTPHFDNANAIWIRVLPITVLHVAHTCHMTLIGSGSMLSNNDISRMTSV